nr:hypothetical protein [Tanacetum cinerariifolium]
EPHHTPSPEADTSHPTTSSIRLPSLSIAPIPPITQTDTTPIRQYLRRARIAQSSALPIVEDEPASPVRDVSEGEACLTESSFIADQDRATIAKSSTLPHDSAPRVTSPTADEGNDALIKGRSINEGEATAERISDDLEELERVLTSMDAATVLAGGIDVPTDSGSIPTAGPPAADISTGSEVALTASPIVTSYSKERSQQRRPMNKKQKRDYYMNMIKNNLGWKVKDFKGMTFKEIEAKFAVVWKHVEDFIPMGSKEEAKRLKRKGFNLEQEHVKKQKTSKEAPEIEKSTEEIPKEKMTEMMQLVPVEDVYVQALQVKHPIIDWKLYDLCGVHQVTAKDKDIFMLVEKDYPLRKGLAIVMISYKLQVETHSRMANELVLKIYKIAKICLYTVLLHSNNSRLSQVGECCFFLGFVSSGCLHLWSSIFADRSDKGFLVRVDQERFVKRVPTSSHSVLLLQSWAMKLISTTLRDKLLGLRNYYHVFLGGRKGTKCVLQYKMEHCNRFTCDAICWVIISINPFNLSIVSFGVDAAMELEEKH